MRFFALLIGLFIFLTAQDKYYKEAMEYKNLKKGVVVYKKKVFDVGDCKDIECYEEFVEDGKKSAYTTVKKANHGKVIWFLMKSFDEGNDKAGGELITYIDSLENKNLYKKLKENTILKLKKRNPCFKEFENIKKDIKDEVKAYLKYKEVSNLCQGNTIYRQIALNKLEKLQEKIKNRGFFSSLWFKIKLFFYKFF